MKGRGVRRIGIILCICMIFSVFCYGEELPDSILQTNGAAIFGAKVNVKAEQAEIVGDIRGYESITLQGANYKLTGKCESKSITADKAQLTAQQKKIDANYTGYARSEADWQINDVYYLSDDAINHLDKDLIGDQLEIKHDLVFRIEKSLIKGKEIAIGGSICNYWADQSIEGEKIITTQPQSVIIYSSDNLEIKADDIDLNADVVAGRKVKIEGKNIHIKGKIIAEEVEIIGDKVSLETSELPEVYDALCTNAHRLYITFPEGNQQEHVYEDFELPTKAEEDMFFKWYDCHLTWESDKPEIISPTGKVTRPNNGKSELVTLTATLEKDGCYVKSDYSLWVPRVAVPRKKEYYSNEAIKAQNQDIEWYSDNVDAVMNGYETENGYFHIGKDTVDSPEEALMSMTMIKDLIGVKAPEKEFRWEETMAMEGRDGDKGCRYSFDQVYEGIRVVGRSLRVFTDDDHIISSYQINYDPNINQSGLKTKPTYTLEQVKKDIEKAYGSSVKYDQAELIIDQSEDEKYALLWDVYFNYEDKEKGPVNRYMIIDAHTGKVILSKIDEGYIIID